MTYWALYNNLDKIHVNNLVSQVKLRPQFFPLSVIQYEIVALFTCVIGVLYEFLGHGEAIGVVL